MVANINPLEFTEADGDYKDQGLPTSFFEAKKVRYIYWRFSLDYAQPGEDGSLQLMASWHGPDGKTWNQDATFLYKKDWTQSWVGGGWGGNAGGNFKPGNYRVDIIYRGKQIASGSFTVR